MFGGGRAVTLVPESAERPDWPRLVAAAIRDRQNPLLIKFKPTAAPPNPKEGWVYWDSTTHKLRGFDGAAWNNFW
jgi:hypothetical protein